MVVADSQNITLETATTTENLLPVELTIHDHYGRETGAILHSLPTILGRDQTADVRLKDPWTSHRHCQIDQMGDVLVVRNLGSKNGIFMQGHRVDESHLLSGDKFTIGQTVVTVKYRHGSQTVISATEATRIVAQPMSLKPETEELLYGVASNADPKGAEATASDQKAVTDSNR
jgi:pSer/pThr/pTyr-binding forkhead associated (FHA) protein